MTASGPTRILIVQPWGVGDTLMTVALFRLIRRFFPQTRISALLAFEEIGQILRASALIDDFTILPQQSSVPTKARTFWNLRRSRFDVAIVATRLSWWYAALARWLTGVPLVITDRNIPFPYTSTSAEIDLASPRFVANGMLLKPLVPELAPSIVDACDGRLTSPPASATAVQFLRELLTGPNRPVYAVHVGSGSQPVKRLPVSVASEAIALLLAGQPDAQVLYIEGPSDPLHASLPAELRDRTRRVAGWSISDLQHLFAHCEAVLTGDTGIIHIAASAGGRAVIAVGPGDIIRARPWGEGHAVIKTRMPPPCMPCYGTPNFGNCPYAVKCMTSISPQDIVAAMRARGEHRLS